MAQLHIRTMTGSGAAPSIIRAAPEEHLPLLRDGDQLQDHVSNAATRLLMALTLRELAYARRSLASLDKNSSS